LDCAAKSGASSVKTARAIVRGCIEKNCMLPSRTPIHFNGKSCVTLFSRVRRNLSFAPLFNRDITGAAEAAAKKPPAEKQPERPLAIENMRPAGLENLWSA